MSRFDGKVALVTGATKGIGQGVAVRLARDGATVAVNHRPGSDPGATLDLIREAGGKGFAAAADTRDGDALRRMVDDVCAREGGLDLVVSNAGICPFVPWDELTDKIWDDVHDTNLRGAFITVQAAAKAMVASGRGGAIVGMSSISAWVGGALQVAYTPTKAGVSSLMRSFAIALGPHRIRCNAVLPGAIYTDINRDDIPPGSAKRAAFEQRVPLGRVGDPADVADVVSFLLSDDARYITGAEVLVDGGMFVNLQ